MQHETVIVLDFGGQYNQLIARRVRENNVYCEIYSYKTDLSVIKAKNPKGIIFTGGPNSVYLEDSPTIDPEIFNWGVPVLGICYGSQLMMHLLAAMSAAHRREYGKTEVFVDTNSKMFTDVQPSTICWMSHNDYIEQAAPGFKITAHTVNCPVAAAENAEKGLYAVQFHPEVLHTAEGKKMLRNFVYNVCGCTGDWKMDSFVENNVKALRERIGDGKVLCALSGGVDSSVLAAMLAKAIGKQLTCVFVDHGLLRKNEKEEVCSVFGPAMPTALISTLSVWMPANATLQSWLVSPSRSASARSSAKSSSVCLKSRPRRSARWISWHRVPFTRMSMSAVWAVSPLLSRATTPLAVCPTPWTSRSWWSRCATCSKTRCVRLAVSWACPNIWSVVSRSPARSWHPHHRRGDPGEGGNRAGCRRDLA